MHQMLMNAPDERRSIKWSFLNSTRLFEYDSSDKKKRWAHSAVSRQSRLISRIRKQFKEDESESGPFTQGESTGPVLLTKGSWTSTRQLCLTSSLGDNTPHHLPRTLSKAMQYRGIRKRKKRSETRRKTGDTTGSPTQRKKKRRTGVKHNNDRDNVAEV